MDAPETRHQSPTVRQASASAVWREMVEHAAVGLARIAIGGRVVEANDALVEILGRPREVIVASRFLDLIEPAVRQRQVERSRDLLAGTLDRFRFEARLADAHARDARDGDGGDPHWIEASVSLVRDAHGHPDYFVAVVRDITQQRRDADRLALLTRASTVLASTLDLEQTLGLVVDLMVPMLADGCAVDLRRDDGTLTDFIAVGHRDPGVCDQLTQMRRRYPPDLERFLGIAQVLRTGETLRVPEVDARMLERLARDPEHRRLMADIGVRSMLYVPLQVRGDTFGAITLANTSAGREFDDEDVSFAEELARRAAAAIDNARLHAESRRAVELRERTLAVVSHDLRNPLQTIGIAQGLLARRLTDEGDAQTRRQLELIRRSVDQMTRQISDLLDLARVDAGTLSIEPAEQCLVGLVRRVVERFEPSAHQQGIALVCRPGDDGLPVVCDAGRIEQVLANLIGNALKFCSRDDEIHVRIDASATDERVRVEVTDTGPGIAPALQSQLFEPYMTGTDNGSRGTGLGLFIARQLVVAHGGNLWVESTPGDGATFVIELPRGGPSP